ncbi:MAG: acyltransferase [Verrucomicrobia bacterium]|nr:acyltransferase [Verrucomicrobiota bacterium]
MRATPAITTRWAALDGLRGLAILGVLFGHLTLTPSTETSPLLAGLAELGGRGVDLFFALSGYLIFTQLRARRARPRWAGAFWRRRAAKILPLYAALLVVVYLVLPPLLRLGGFETKLATQTGASGDWPWYATFTSNWLNFHVGRFINPALDVAWSLAIEVQFYALISFVFALRPDGGTRRFWWLIAAAALVFRLGMFYADANWIQILVATPARLDAFAAGLLLARGIKPLPAWLRALGLLGLLAAALPAWSREGAWGMTLGYTWFALGCAALLDIARQPLSIPSIQKLLTLPALTWLGTRSYALYLTHLPLRAALRDLLLPATQMLSPGGMIGVQLLFYAGAGSVCLVTGHLAWSWLEKPARKRILRSA